MINNVVLVGRLTKDAELRYTANGTAVASCTLAVNRDFKNANGDQEADFINCIFWKKTAETLANYVKKGHQIAVVGRIQTRNYENQQGQRVYVTEVVVERLNFLEKEIQVKIAVTKIIVSRISRMTKRILIGIAIHLADRQSIFQMMTCRSSGGKEE